jgi:predicted esterase
VLVIQGRNDSRTPAYPVEVFERRMKDMGKDITVHWYDTGHAGAFGSVDASIAHQERMMCFAQQVLEKRN